jgi:hypothetical protein
MLRAAGSSTEQPTVRSRRAIELADAVSDLDLKRGLLSPLMNTGGLNRSTKNGLRYLARCDPDLVPTTEWLLSA